MKRLALALFLLIPSLSHAERRDNFAPCSKSNDCKSLRCSEGVCKPSGTWNGQGAIGDRCENDSNCKSRECKSQRCVAAPAAPSSTPKRASPRSTDDTATDSDDTAAVPAVANDVNDPVTLDACGQDLRATVFANGGQFADHHSRSICTNYSKEIIARAKVLWSAGYADNFSLLCKELETRTEAEIECARKKIDALPPEAKRRTVQLIVKGECRAYDSGIVLDDCGKDLVATVLTEVSRSSRDATAKKICETYPAETIAKAKKIKAAGYGGDFMSICREIDKRTDAAIACSQAYYDTHYPGRQAQFSFQLQRECEKK